MAIHKIHAVPRDLPHARLYLDDIEEISGILLEVVAEALADSGRRRESNLGSPAQSQAGKAATEAVTARDLNVSYTIGDTRMDSVADLQTYGGSTSNFKIRVGSWGNNVSFYFSLRPTIELYSLDEERQWSTYGKIKSIFDRRQLRTKNAIAGLPGWLKWSAWILFSTIPTAITLTSMGKSIELYVLTGWLIVLALFAFLLWRRSRVFLVRSHERSKMASEKRRSYARDIIFIAIGAVISQLVSRLFHK